MTIGLELSMRSSGAPWTTKRIANLAAWWRGDSSLDASTANVWADRSGNGHVFVQATAGKRTALVADGIGGRPAAAFDGNDHLDCTTLTLTRPYTIALVGYTATQNGRFFLDGVSAGSRTVLYGPSGTQIAAYGTVATTATVDASSAKIMIATYNDASSSLRINGASTAGATGGAGMASGLRLGAAADDSAGSHLSGRVAEVIVYSRVLTAAEYARLEQYLSSRYSIALS